MEYITIITLIVAGVLLVMAEIFVPGGFVGSIGGILLLIGIVGAFFRDPTVGFGLLIATLIFALVMFWLWMKFLPRSRVGKRFILQTDAGTWAGYDSAHSDLLGKHGITRSPLHPGGIAQIGGKRVDVVTRGEAVAANQPIQVIEVRGNRIVVAQAETEEQVEE